MKMMMKGSTAVLLVLLVAYVSAEDWCVNERARINIRYGSCSNVPTFEAPPGTCLTRTDDEVQYCNGLRYFTFGAISACTESEYMHPCVCQEGSGSFVPPPRPTSASCVGDETRRLRNVRGALADHIGELKCSSEDTSYCGQCTHFVKWATNTRLPVSTWKKVRSVRDAIELGTIESGDVIATFDGTFSTCGFGGHVAVFDEYDSDADIIFVYHQNGNGVRTISRGAIQEFDEFFTVSLYAASAKRFADAVDATCVDGSCDPAVSLECSGSGPCDDGNPCTASDSCVGGTCRGEPVLTCAEPSSVCQLVELAQNDAGTCECVVMNVASPQACSKDGCRGECVDGECKASSCKRPSVSSALTAASASSCSFPVVREGDRTSGSIKREVVSLQYLLRYRGFYSGSIDGDFGPGTKRWVQQYQTSIGETADGIVGSRTWSRLAPQTARASGANDAARAVQDLLRNRWSQTVTVDGQFGPGTEGAVSTFQRSKGLTASGVVDETTWQFLLNKDCGGGSGGSGGSNPGSGNPSPSGPATTADQQINSAGIQLIKSSEGFFSCYYLDPAGLPTIGYGHLITASDPYGPGDCISEAEADRLLQSGIDTAESCVNRYVNVAITRNQFSALVDFTFNLGCGSLQSSTLLRRLNNGEYSAVCSELARWVYADGQIFQGLVTRRAAECVLWNA